MDKTVEMEMKLTIARRDLKKLLASELITATMIKGSLAKQELLTRRSPDCEEMPAPLRAHNNSREDH